MRFFGRLGAGACALLASISAQAETLTVEGIYPAGNSDAAKLESIAVERLGGEDGSRLSTMISDRLRAVRIDGEAWFRIYSGSLSSEAEAALSGFVSTDISIDESYSKEVNTCVRRDENRKCIERRKEKIPCDRARVTVRPSLRLVGRDGRLLHSGTTQVQREVRFCADENQPSLDPLIDQALNEVADLTRAELAPEQRRDAIRVFESRKGMERAAGRQFREAIRLTKRDELAACNAFAALEPTIGAHRSLIFNLALCAEAAGDFNVATDYYSQTLSMGGDTLYANEGLNRIESRLTALDQLEARYR